VDAFQDKKIIKVSAGPDFNYALTSVRTLILFNSRMEKYIPGATMILVS
jgi:hypothetical protein